MTVLRIYCGDARLDRVDAASHRGIAYGDGLFETMRVHDGDVHWWPRHWARLSRGAQRLRITLPDHEQVKGQWQDMCAAVPAATLKLSVHRSGTGRGYAPTGSVAASWQLALSGCPLPAAGGGMSLRWCTSRLAAQPLLAGIKHCNRLEQVLARLEWDTAGAPDRDADEGLLCDMDGHVISAISANLFVLQEGVWLTPAIETCGVAGVCRDWCIEALAARPVRLAPAQVEAADVIFLCNALRGILPVQRLGARQWPVPHPAVEHARALLAAGHPAFSMEYE